MIDVSSFKPRIVYVTAIDATPEAMFEAPPRRFSRTWSMVSMPQHDLPDCPVAYEIEPARGCVRMTMTKAHQEDIPDAMLSDGRAGWPAILSSLKSVLESGKRLAVMEQQTEMPAALPARKQPSRHG